MKFKFIFCLALGLGVGLLAEAQPKTDIGIPIIAAPKMRECREAKTKDLGVWDDAFRFENLDFILLRKQNELFSYSLITSDLKRIRIPAGMADTRIREGMTWGKHQWVFCQSDTTIPFALDLANGKRVPFEIPEVKAHGGRGAAIHTIINPGFEFGTIIAITGNGVAGWPRDGNLPLYYWMNLESGRVVKLPTGWDLSYFSADQKRAVFETISTNAMMYRPWITADMATGEVVNELPNQTKGIWSEPISGYWQEGIERWNSRDYRRHIWELRSARTPLELQYPQPGRGHADDKFTGLSVNGVGYSFSITNAGMDRCVDAKFTGNLAAIALQTDGSSDNFLWLAQLGKEEKPILVATNCSFEMLSDRRCALLLHNQFLGSMAEALVYDVESSAAWNVLDGVPLQAAIMSRLSDAARLGTIDLPGKAASGMGPMIAFQLIPGFGSARYPAEVLCLCSTAHVVPANLIPPRVQRVAVLLTAQGSRYQINLPASMRKLSLNDSWLHNSGKLIIGEYKNTSKNRGQLHLYVANLRTNQK